MKKIIFISILFIAIYSHSYSQNTLIGNWRRVDPALKTQDLKNKQIRNYDLEIRPDSTFHIQGDTARSGISGWHVGEDYKGTWEEKDSSHLTFWLEPKQNRMFLAYKIVKLTREKLVLRILPDINSSRNNDIIYLRL